MEEKLKNLKSCVLILNNMVINNEKHTNVTQEMVLEAKEILEELLNENSSN